MTVTDASGCPAEYSMIFQDAFAIATVVLSSSKLKISSLPLGFLLGFIEDLSCAK